MMQHARGIHALQRRQHCDTIDPQENVMSRVLKWGILGTARINRALLPPLAASERNELTAIASRTQARADEYAAEHSVPRAYGSYAELLADPEIDVVYIPLPNGMHAEWTLAAVRAGKHVLCEKPLTLSVEDVDRIADESRKTGVVVAEAFMYRHHPLTVAARERVLSGAIGQVLVIRGAFTFTLSWPNDVRLDPSQGGGSVWDIGCYPVSYARFVLGEEPVEAFGWQASGPTGIDEVFVGQLRFPGGAYAQFDSGFKAPYRSEIEIVGTDGAIRVRHPFKPGLHETLEILRNEETVETDDIPGQELYSGEVEDMADAILSGKSPHVTLADSRGNCAALLALLRSAREGRPVAVKRFAP
jgi:xylose dehydrogenase (NAD/NADP)